MHTIGLKINLLFKRTLTAAAVIQPGTGLWTFAHLVYLSNCPVELSKCLQDIL
jgi:hypothetical protein